jgi:bacterioferritin-associated ferredoxin
LLKIAPLRIFAANCSHCRRAGMIICVCNRINDHDIRAAARAGATCCKQVFGGKGTAPQCGSCLDAMGEILDETIAAGERHLMAAE